LSILVLGTQQEKVTGNKWINCTGGDNPLVFTRDMEASSEAS
jgi:hypothetical protein